MGSPQFTDILIHNNPNENHMKKVALITGANKGIGLEIARQLGKKDITIIASGRSQERVQAAVDQLKGEGIDAHGLQLDLEDPSTFAGAVKFVEDNFGKLDILVNNAGVQIEADAWVGNTTEGISQEVLKRTFQINFFGLVELTQLLLPFIKKSDAGRIVNLTSILGSLTLHATPGSPIYGTKMFGYNASKAAVNMFTIHLADALKDTNIKVNSAHPGWVKTDMGGDDAMIGVEEGAKTAVDFALAGNDSPNAEYSHLGDILPW